MNGLLFVGSDQKELFKHNSDLFPYPPNVLQVFEKD